MSDENDKKRIVLLVALLLAAGGVFAWVLTRGPAEVDDATESKASELTRIIQEQDARRAESEPPEPPPPPAEGGPADMRSRGSGG